LVGGKEDACLDYFFGKRRIRQLIKVSSHTKERTPFFPSNFKKTQSSEKEGHVL